MVVDRILEPVTSETQLELLKYPKFPLIFGKEAFSILDENP